MKASGFIESGTDLDNPDFAAMARAMGIHAVRVDDPVISPVPSPRSFPTMGPRFSTSSRRSMPAFL
jgi:hypothetical protein